MRAGYITFGKYKSKTLEELCFRDFQYVDWMLREFDPEDRVVKHLKQLFRIAREKPVKGRCSNCGKKPSLFSIAHYAGRANAREAWRVCSDCREKVSRQAGGGLFFCRISFEGFRKFVGFFEAKGDAKEFGLALARAWGIGGPKDKLTKKRIFAFFGAEK